MARYLVGSFVLLGLAACGRQWLAEREPWRHEAEVACLKSGAIKEGAAMVRIEPITGPGVCGADFPYKVSAFGDSAALSYRDDDLRPPRGVPSRFPLADAPPGADPSQPYLSAPAPRPSRAYPAQYPSAENGPMSINPPGTLRPEVDDEGEFQLGEPDAPAPPATVSPRHAAPASPMLPPPVVEQVPLGRERPPASSPAVAVQPAATLACPIVSSLDKWLADDVQPAAMKWIGSPLVGIRQFSAYSCRTVNNQGRSLSEHAFGNALDIAIFTFADGRKINVEHGWRGPPEEQGFLRDIHAAACKHFSTVLGPGADVFHYNHFHLDMRLRRNGYTVCRPKPVPGDLVAGRSPYPRRGEVTGSIKPEKRTRMPAQQQVRRGREIDDGLPVAVPGED